MSGHRQNESTDVDVRYAWARIRWIYFSKYFIEMLSPNRANGQTLPIHVAGYLSSVPSLIFILTCRLSNFVRNCSAHAP